MSASSRTQDSPNHRTCKFAQNSTTSPIAAISGCLTEHDPANFLNNGEQMEQPARRHGSAVYLLSGRNFATDKGGKRPMPRTTHISRRSLLRSAALGTLAVASGTKDIFAQRSSSLRTSSSSWLTTSGSRRILLRPPDLSTPNIDRIAKKAFACPGVANSAVCSATRTAFDNRPLPISTGDWLGRTFDCRSDVGLPPYIPRSRHC